LAIAISKNGKNLALKIFPKSWQMFWNAMIFGNIYQIWLHVAALVGLCSKNRSKRSHSYTRYFIAKQ